MGSVEALVAVLVSAQPAKGLAWRQAEAGGGLTAFQRLKDLARASWGQEGKRAGRSSSLNRDSTTD